MFCHPQKNGPQSCLLLILGTRDCVWSRGGAGLKSQMELRLLIKCLGGERGPWLLLWACVTTGSLGEEGGPESRRQSDERRETQVPLLALREEEFG